MRILCLVAILIFWNSGNMAFQGSTMGWRKQLFEGHLKNHNMFLNVSGVENKVSPLLYLQGAAWGALPVIFCREIDVFNNINVCFQMFLGNHAFLAQFHSFRMMGTWPV